MIDIKLDNSKGMIYSKSFKPEKAYITKDEDLINLDILNSRPGKNTPGPVRLIMESRTAIKLAFALLMAVLFGENDDPTTLNCGKLEQIDVMGKLIVVMDNIKISDSREIKHKIYKLMKSFNEIMNNSPIKVLLEINI